MSPKIHTAAYGFNMKKRKEFEQECGVGWGEERDLTAVATGCGLRR
jgi:hypothetical protein